MNQFLVHMRSTPHQICAPLARRVHGHQKPKCTWSSKPESVEVRRSRGQDEEGRNAREKSGIRRDAWAKRCEIDVGEIVCVRI